jgi:hypothetical protein
MINGPGVDSPSARPSIIFVGFVGGYTKAVLGVDDVLLGGIAAACLVTWFTL